jgi:uncharacterized membrane protein
MKSRTAITIAKPRDDVERLWHSAEHGPTYVRQTDATVRFKDAPGDRGTEIHVELGSTAPGGKLGEAVQGLVGAAPLARDAGRHGRSGGRRR